MVNILAGAEDGKNSVLPIAAYESALKAGESRSLCNWKVHWFNEGKNS